MTAGRESWPRPSDIEGAVRFLKGIMAAFIATLALAVLLLLKEALGMVPRIDVIGLTSDMLGGPVTGPVPEALGWVALFGVGTLLGLLFPMVEPLLPGRRWERGAWFAVAAWLALMLLFMPAAGAGFFGYAIGPMVPVVTLVFLIAYGAVLGGIFGRLAGRKGLRAA